MKIIAKITVYDTVSAAPIRITKGFNSPSGCLLYLADYLREKKDVRILNISLREIPDDSEN